MTLEVLTPELRLYSGEITGVKLPGTKGSFEILKGHAPIISSLSEGMLRIQSAGKTEEIEIQSGFVECLNDHIVVLVEGGRIA